MVMKVEPDNDLDLQAVAIYTQEGYKLGYVPGLYSKEIFALMENGAHPQMTILSVNESSTSHWWVKVDFVSEIPEVNSTASKETLSFYEVAV